MSIRDGNPHGRVTFFFGDLLFGVVKRSRVIKIVDAMSNGDLSMCIEIVQRASAGIFVQTYEGQWQEIARSITDEDIDITWEFQPREAGGLWTRTPDKERIRG